jgi:uncharacterized protein
MTQEFVPHRLDIRAFAAAQGTFKMLEKISKYERLTAECQLQESPTDASHAITWQATGQLRQAEAAADSVWLHVQASATLPLMCQRCLTPVMVPLQVDRWFRFVADEATAEREDEASEEDLLAISREFDLSALVEDELLMELPAVASHDTCPEGVQWSAGVDDFQAAQDEKPKPFAALAYLKTSGSNKKSS